MERSPPKQPPSERELVLYARRRLEGLVPEGWRIEVGNPPLWADDALVIVAPDDRTRTFLVEAKANVDARSVPYVREQLGLGPDERGLVVTRYASPRAREALAAAGLSYVDVTGNAWLSSDVPGLAIREPGADRDPYRTPDRPTNSLRGMPAGRVVRGLIDGRPPWRIRELAAFAGTSLGSTARTVDFLDREALLVRNDTGMITDVRWDDLLRRWAADYQVERHGRLVRAAVARGVDYIAPALRDEDVPYVISGSLAARRYVEEAEARLAVVYATDVQRVLDAVRAREVDARPNLLAIEVRDDGALVRPVINNGIRFAGLSQVVVDLLAGPGRTPEEGEALLRWMAADPERWR